MTNDERFETVLGKKYAATLLIYLLDRKEVMGRVLRDICTNYTTMVQLARELERLDLIKIELISSPFVMHRYHLTERGKRVADDLKKVEEYINGRPRES